MRELPIVFARGGAVVAQVSSAPIACARHCARGGRPPDPGWNSRRALAREREPDGLARGRKGRSDALVWFFAGFLLGPLALIAVGLAPTEHASHRNRRECPRCAELIPKQAAVCSFCGTDVEPAAALPTVDSVGLGQEPSPEGASAWCFQCQAYLSEGQIEIHRGQAHIVETRWLRSRQPSPRSWRTYP